MSGIGYEYTKNHWTNNSFILYFLFFLGSWIQETLNLFIPGSIIGLILLFFLLTTGIVKEQWIENGSLLLIRYLPLLFLPVTVGIINFPELFNVKGILLVVVTVVSTCIVMIGTGWISQLLLVKRRSEEDES